MRMKIKITVISFVPLKINTSCITCLESADASHYFSRVQAILPVMWFQVKANTGAGTRRIRAGDGREETERDAGVMPGREAGEGETLSF